MSDQSTQAENNESVVDGIELGVELDDGSKAYVKVTLHDMNLDCPVAAGARAEGATMIGRVTIYRERDNVGRTYVWWEEPTRFAFVTPTGALCPDREAQTICAQVIDRFLRNVRPDPDATIH
jgi:hypothetical protein